MVKIKIDETQPVVESPDRAKFLKIIEAYKIKNPVKYAAKKEELEKKLAALK